MSALSPIEASMRWLAIWLLGNALIVVLIAPELPPRH